jgi:hypothetical protein
MRGLETFLSYPTADTDGLEMHGELNSFIKLSRKHETMILLRVVWK